MFAPDDSLKSTLRSRSRVAALKRMTVLLNSCASASAARARGRGRARRH